MYSSCANFEHLPMELQACIIKKLLPREQSKMKLVSHSLFHGAQMATLPQKKKSFKMYLLYPHLSGFDFWKERGWLKKPEKVLREILQNKENKKLFFDMFFYFAAPEFFSIQKLNDVFNVNVGPETYYNIVFQKNIDDELQEADCTFSRQIVQLENDVYNKNSTDINMVYIIRGVNIFNGSWNDLDKSKKNTIFKKIVKDISLNSTDKIRIIFNKDNLNIADLLNILVEQIKEYDVVNPDKKISDCIKYIDICPLYVELLKNKQDIAEIKEAIGAIEKVLMNIQFNILKS